MSVQNKKRNRKKITRKKITKLGASSTKIEKDPTITRYGVGMDVHKDSVMVSVHAQTKENIIIEVITHKFKNTPLGLQEMISFLKKYKPTCNYLMECTGVYHRPVYRALMSEFGYENNKIIAMNPL